MSESAKIEIMDDGPLIAAGVASLEGPGGREIGTGKKTALCRCGKSGNKPFCDGSHRAAGFKSSFSSSEPPEAKADAEKVVRVLPDGPYEVGAGVGLAVEPGSRLSGEEPYYLCRCGASENKPFCDGSHRKVGFTDG